MWNTKTCTVIIMVSAVLAAAMPANAQRAASSAEWRAAHASRWRADLAAASWRARQLALFTLGYGSYYGWGWPLYAREYTGYGHPYDTYASYYAFAPKPCGAYPVYGCGY